MSTDPAILALTTLEEGLKESYKPGIQPTWYRTTGRRAARMVGASPTRVTGDGINLRFEHRAMDAVRPVNRPLQDYGTPGSFDMAALKVRYNLTDAAAHDFTGFDASVQISSIELANAWNGSDQDMENLVAGATRRLINNFADNRAAYLQLPRTGVICLVNGNLKKNDNPDYGAASATGFASSARFKVDGGIPSFLKPGYKIEVEKSDGTGTVYATVAHFNYVDRSLGVTVDSDSPNTFGSTNSAYDNGKIYQRGAKGLGMHGFRSWFDAPTAGETWIGGIDRTSADWQHINPIRHRVGAAVATVSREFVDEVLDGLEIVREEGEQGAIFGNTLMINAFKRDLGDKDVVYQSPQQAQGSRRGTELRTIYMHPATPGGLELVADPLIPDDRLYIVSPGTWETYHYGAQEINAEPGGDHMGWYRTTAADGSSRSKYWRKDFSQKGMVLWCNEPERNAVILNLKHTA